MTSFPPNRHQAVNHYNAVTSENLSPAKFLNNFQDLIASLSLKKGGILVRDKGLVIRHSFSQLAVDVQRAKMRLQTFGVQKFARIGIYAPNSYQWLVYDLAIACIGAISVALPDGFGSDLASDSFEYYELSLLLTSDTFKQNLPAEIQAYTASIDAEGGPAKTWPRAIPNEEDLHDQFSMVFSSGSAGGLKGILISTEGTLKCLAPVIEAVGVRSTDRLFLFLPMSNYQQRFLCYAALMHDFDIALSNTSAIFEDLVVLEPTILLAPPVFYQMMYRQYGKEYHSSSVRRLLSFVLSLLPGALKLALASILFPAFYKQLGRRIRLLVTGMAPVEPAVKSFFSRMGIPLAEAYGMVEAGVIAYRSSNDWSANTVGRPLKDINLTLGDDGELIISRPKFVALRYFQCAEGENDKTFGKPGKISTGDICARSTGGRLKLLGRKKELIVLANGKKIHPEAVEAALNDLQMIDCSTLFVDVNGVMTAVVALTGDVEETEICQLASKIVRDATGEQFVRIELTHEPFSVSNGLLRPNLKLDRQEIKQRFSPKGRNQHGIAKRIED